MIAELLTMWGVKAAWSAFGPVLEDLAKDVAKDGAKSYVGKCFGSVFSAVSREPLTKGAGRMVKELLDLLEYELGLDEDTEREELIQMQRAVSAFLKQQEMRESITALLQGEQLDSAVLAQAWQNVQDVPALPEGFSWPKISKGFNRKAKEIRDSIPELKAIFAQNAAVKADEALASSIGPQPGIDLDIYAEAVLEKFGRPGSLALASVDLDGPAYDAVRLWQVFVSQSVRECRDYRPQQLELPKGEEQRLELRPYFERHPRPVLEVCADQQLQRLVLLGDPGSGKSSLLRFLALEWARDNAPNRRALAPVPLLIELRDYHSKRRQRECSDNFLSYLHKAYSLHRFNQNALDALLKSTPGRFLLLLDGLDEILDRQEREQVISDIHRFSNEYKEVRIIVTSRMVGYEAHRLRDAEFHDFKLEEFSSKQITQFLDRWHEIIFAGNQNQKERDRKRKRLAKAISESYPIRLLAGNPLLLTMMAIINRNQELPRDRVRLYEKATELLLQQWDTEAKLLPDFPGLSAEIDFRAKSAILRKVAVAMQNTEGQAASQIEGERLIKLMEEYLRDALGFNQARAAAIALVRQLRERNFILCFLGGDSYAFVHRTFLEYFCAAEYVYQFERERNMTILDLRELFKKHCNHADWQEILRLICGQVGERFAGDVIKDLTEMADIESEDSWDEWSRRPYELLLAVRCLIDIRNINLINKDIGYNLLIKVMGCSFIKDFSNQLLDAGRAVGSKWPGRAKCQTLGDDNQYIWPLFIAIVFRDELWLRQLCQSRRNKIRKESIQVLARYWPNENTIQLLREQCPFEGAAAFFYGKEHSRFGEIVFRMRIQIKDDNYLNPRQPIPVEHIQEAARFAGIPPDKIDETVRSLSAHMGWDITKGSLAGKL